MPCGWSLSDRPSLTLHRPRGDASRARLKPFYVDNLLFWTGGFCICSRRISHDLDVINLSDGPSSRWWGWSTFWRSEQYGKSVVSTFWTYSSQRELEGNAHSRLRNRHLSVFPVMSCRPQLPLSLLRKVTTSLWGVDKHSRWMVCLVMVW